MASAASCVPSAGTRYAPICMTRSPTPKLNHRLAWLRQPNARSLRAMGIRGEGMSGGALPDMKSAGRELSSAISVFHTKKWQEGGLFLDKEWRASLREDYLNQVQRDFLSRIALKSDAAPLAVTPCSVRVILVRAGLKALEYPARTIRAHS